MSHTPTPWIDQHKYLDTKLAMLSEVDYGRAKVCVNACEGMEDPVAEIAQLKAENENLKQGIKDYDTVIINANIKTDMLKQGIKDAIAEMEQATNFGGMPNEHDINYQNIMGEAIEILTSKTNIQ